MEIKEEKMEVINFIIHNFSNLFVIFGLFGIVVETSPKIRWNRTKKNRG